MTINLETKNAHSTFRVPHSTLNSLSVPLCLCVSFLLLTFGATAADRPNILWLIAEDFGPHLGCYGTKEVTTPNLDGLAAEGVRYTRFFTTAPVCSPVAGLKTAPLRPVSPE